MPASPYFFLAFAALLLAFGPAALAGGAFGAAALSGAGLTTAFGATALAASPRGGVTGHGLARLVTGFGAAFTDAGTGVGIGAGAQKIIVALFGMH